MKHRLTITPEDNNSGDYDLYIALDSVESEDEVHDAGYYIEKRQKNGPGSVTRNFTEQTENRESTAEDSSDSSEAFAGAVGERESESSGPLELIDDIVDIVFTLVVIATIIGFVVPFSIPVFDLSDDIQGFLSNNGSDNNDAPEDVTEAYFQAVAEGDYEAAMSYATEEAASNYSRDQFDALSSNEPEIEEVGATREISGRKVVFITVSEETVIGRNSEIMEVYFEQQNDSWYITQICYDSGTCQSGLGVKPDAS
jgi:hypothetical protein